MPRRAGGSVFRRAPASAAASAAARVRTLGNSAAAAKKATPGSMNIRTRKIISLP